MTQLPPDELHTLQPLFKDFTLGTPALLGSHRIDVATWFMDDPLPVSAVALGGVYVWKDGREHADTVDCILEYPKKFILNYSTRLGNKFPAAPLTFYGTRGTFDNQTWTARGEGGGQDALTEPVTVEADYHLVVNRDYRDPHLPGFANHLIGGSLIDRYIVFGELHPLSVEKLLHLMAVGTSRRGINGNVHLILSLYSSQAGQFLK